mgnify:CR=1 FL=1|jgi:hypothetical protein
MFKYAIVTLLTVLLAACGGGGGSDGSSEATVQSFDESLLVDGQYKALAEIENSASACEGVIHTTTKDIAFESDNFLVFAETRVLEKSLNMVATFSEQGLELIAEKFGVSVEELTSYRPHYSSNAFEFIKTTWLSQFSAPTARSIDHLEPGVLPTNYDELDYYDQNKLLHDYFYGMTKEEQLLALQRAVVIRGRDVDTFLDDYGIEETPEKLVVCVNDSSVSTAQAWGGRYRIQPPENAAEWNRENNFEKYQRILVHELVHVITYSIPSQTESLLIPIWFMEGMAEYLTGGKIASSVDRNFILDRNEILFSEYSEAARVVAYIVETLGNGDRSIYDLMVSMRSYATGEEQYFHSSYLDNISFNAFPQAFSDVFVDYDGSELTLEKLHSEYFERLN